MTPLNSTVVLTKSLKLFKGNTFSIKFFIFLFFLYPLYYTKYNTAHAASRLWRYSSIYMNPSQAA